MHESATLSRRAAAALPLAALLGPASAALPTATPAAADGALLELGRRWRMALETERAHYATFDPAMSYAEAEAHDAYGEALYNLKSDLFDEIAMTPAVTPAGLATKARILAYKCDLEDLDEVAIATALAQRPNFLDRAALSLALDCIRLAGGSPA